MSTKTIVIIALAALLYVWYRQTYGYSGETVLPNGQRLVF